MPTAPTASTLRVFVPDSCTQGGELACHATWKEDGIRAVTVAVPEALELVSSFNARHTETKGQHRFEDFEVPGYVGLVFKVRVQPEARVKLKVRVQVEGAENERRDFDVVVFRPLLEAHARLEGRLEGAIVTKNLGFGTSIIQLKVPSNSPLDLEKPPGLKEFQEGFRKDLASRIPRLKELHPDNSDLLEPMAEIFAADIPLTDPDRMEELRAFFEDLGDAMTENQSFESDVVDAIIGAFMNNTKGSTYFEKALEYLQSLANDNIILLNPLDTLIIPKGRQEFNLHLATTDRSYNHYPVVKIEGLKHQSTKETRIPVHVLFAKEAN